MIWAFGDHELDEGLYALRARGRTVKIEPKVFDVLLYLLRHRERVVSKHELLDALWPGEAVSDAVLPRCIAAARRAVGDDRSRQAVLQTVHGRGYRFVAPLRELGSDGSPAAAQREAAPEPVRAGGGRSFVGRADPIGRLREALEHARGGSAGVVLLAGEPGIGKTRTTEEIGAEAAALGVRWLAGRCHEGEGAPAFWPWVQVLRAAIGGADAAALVADLGPGAADLVELVPELRGPVPDLPAPRGLEGDQARFRLFDAVAGFLARHAERAPLLVSVDDLHWADPDSLRLFGFLAGELRDARVLLLGAYRDVEVRRQHPLGALLGDLARSGRCQRVALRGLASPEVAELVESVTGTAPDPELAHAVAGLTEGNPFFVQEVARLLGESGRFDAATVAHLALPQGVRDAVGRRLDTLSDECNAVLRAASVFGRVFELRWLERVVEPDGEALLELLGEALAAQVLVETPDGVGRFAFRHALLRQTLYEELSAPRRVALHRRVAEVLETVYAGRPDAPLAELAHHFFAALPAGNAEAALRWAVQAAERAHALFAYDESARHYERALEALELCAPDEARRCQMLIALGEQLWFGGARKQARARLGEAADLARRIGREDLLAHAAVCYRGFGEMGMPPEAKTLALLEEARDAVGDGHPALRARLLARLVGTPPYSLTMAGRERLSDECAELARRSGDPVALADAVSARYWATLGPDRIGERLAVAREAAELGRRFESPQLVIVASEIEIGVHLLRGEVGAAARECARYEELATELRQPLFVFLATMIRASLAVSAGRFAEAEELIHTALERGRGRVEYAEAVHAGQIYWLLFQRGETGALARALEAGVLRRMAGLEGLMQVQRALASVAEGRLDEARRAFEGAAARDFAELERDESWLTTMSLAATAACLLDDADRGERLYELLLPYRDLAVSHDLLRAVAGSVESVLGRLALLCGRGDAAVDHLERAVLREQAMGTRPALVHSRLALADALARRGGRGDAGRARSLRQEAGAEADALGLPRPGGGPVGAARTF